MKPILAHLLSKEEFYTLSKRLLHAIASSAIPAPGKDLLVNRLQAPFQVYEAALNRSVGNPLTKEVEVHDAFRDQCFLGFRTQVEAHTYHWDTSKQAAAKALREVIRRHSWTMQNNGYKKQTAQQGALIQEIGREPAAIQLQLLGLEEWFQQLVNAGQAFEQILQKREMADSQESVTLVDSRKALYNDLQATLSFLESQMAFAASAELQQLIHTLNEIITGVTSVAKARHTRRQTEEAVRE